MTKIVSRNNVAGKGAPPPLSSGAYFDAKFERYHAPRTTDRTKSARWNATHVTSANSRRKRHDRPYKIQIHADMMKVSSSDSLRGIPDKTRSNRPAILPDVPFPYGGVISIDLPYNPRSTRGAVTGFSQASRRRMMQFMASIRYQGEMLFLTLTYDDGSLQRSEMDLKAEFEAFRRRFERKYPKWSAIWRVEYIERKSGDLIGRDEPHYHFIIFTNGDNHYEKVEDCVESFRQWGNEAWHEITGSQDENHLIYGCDVSPVRSRRHAYSYVSKYIGKTTTDNLQVGRRWGRIGTFDCTPSETFFIDEDELIVLKRIVKSWLNKQATARHRAKQQNAKHPVKPNAKKTVAMCRRWWWNLTGQGITVLGLGDTDDCGQGRGLMPPFAQFINEAIRQVRERRERDRGYGN